MVEKPRRQDVSILGSFSVESYYIPCTNDMMAYVYGVHCTGESRAAGLNSTSKVRTVSFSKTHSTAGVTQETLVLS